MEDSGAGKSLKDNGREVGTAEEAAEPNEPAPPLPETTFLDTVRFVPFVAAFGAILLFFDPLQRIAILFGPAAHQRVVGWLNWSLRSSLGILGVKVVVHGEDAVPEGEPVIIISNHQSLFDIPILYTVFAKHRPRFIAKQELGKWIPSVSYNLRRGGSALIDRSNARQAIPEIQALAERLVERKFAAIIFPEGTRAKDGRAKKFRPAGMSTLIQGAPTARIIPVVIENSWILSARKRGPIPAGTTVRVRILSEIDRSGLKAKNLVAHAESEIHQALRELRAEKGSN